MLKSWNILPYVTLHKFFSLSWTKGSLLHQNFIQWLIKTLFMKNDFPIIQGDEPLKIKF